MDLKLVRQPLGSSKARTKVTKPKVTKPEVTKLMVTKPKVNGGR